MRKRRLLVLIPLTASSFLATNSSSSSAGSNLCPANRVCIYSDNNWVGLLGFRAAKLGIANVSAGANDKTDSWENKTATDARWYYDTNGGGNCHTMARNTERANLAWGPSDELSSWATNGRCS
ncbi:MAG: hypothetical protein F2534_05250 [Actinobacteria bacterium]|uniref:Unannotated protein n=1 Tax=freshwater metagenome TaxID=449393 RepID=A0A6J6CEY9_9ZZZZ|nr:hypothetical protein [Actinomycetota bacterium]